MLSIKKTNTTERKKNSHIKKCFLLYDFFFDKKFKIRMNKINKRKKKTKKKKIFV